MPRRNSALWLLCFLLLPKLAWADGDELLPLFAFLLLPAQTLIFLLLTFLSGLQGRMWYAAGIYAAVIVGRYNLEWSRSYQELVHRLSLDVTFPPLDVFLFPALSLPIIYLIVRDRRVRIMVRMPLPRQNLIFGMAFSIIGIAIWWLPLGETINGWLRTLSNGLTVPLFLFWFFCLPIPLAWCAYRLFRYGGLLRSHADK